MFKSEKIGNFYNSTTETFQGVLWAAVFTFNPYLLISINELRISIIHLLISINSFIDIYK